MFAYLESDCSLFRLLSRFRTRARAVPLNSLSASPLQITAPSDQADGYWVAICPSAFLLGLCIVHREKNLPADKLPARAVDESLRRQSIYHCQVIILPHELSIKWEGPFETRTSRTFTSMLATSQG